jgi:hypothetical protein
MENMMDWQPIETAPTDGSIILATWADTWPEHPHVEGMYYDAGEWFYSYDGDGNGRPPTHWCPITSPLSKGEG